ncbi:hypothetical protein HLH44_17790 [Gluconacetobacter sp. 1c LMG 22058]|uniref:Uncharacterized protein n=1 Tax=Gluconacetobacter dulcium TaxID=2729096 RepID=A0A7W4K2P2_9PROT|nr:hypothetical protein [Gluconacetobacter dulcium]MBB2199265.1 hypothetical protein [Gluconacetobacter dulcium]
MTWGAASGMNIRKIRDATFEGGRFIIRYIVAPLGNMAPTADGSAYHATMDRILMSAE